MKIVIQGKDVTIHGEPVSNEWWDLLPAVSKEDAQKIIDKLVEGNKKYDQQYTCVYRIVERP